jgi:hypothetical protein
MARVVIAAPLFDKAAYLPAAVESLLAQTYADFALLLIDDRSDDATEALARGFATADPRVEYHRNPRRLGMLGNTNRAFALARERHPEAEFWALGSDHDLWDPRWLETLVALLDAHPEALLAYPQSVRIDEHGVPYDRGGKPPWRSETVGIAAPGARLRAAYRGMVAGDMIYGLFRIRALDELGDLYRPVLVRTAAALGARPPRRRRAGAGGAVAAALPRPRHAGPTAVRLLPRRRAAPRAPALVGAAHAGARRRLRLARGGRAAHRARGRRPLHGGLPAAGARAPRPPPADPPRAPAQPLPTARGGWPTGPPAA